MSKIVRHYYFSWQEEKEKAFLEKMAKEGYRLIEANTTKYTFEQCDPIDLVYEIDFKGLAFDDVDDYLQIHQDAGWQLAADKGSWFYFCKEKSNEINNHLFNDNSSKLEKYRRLLGFIASLWILTFFYTLLSISFSVRAEAAMSDTAVYILMALALTLPGILFFRVWFKYHQLKNLIKE